MLTVCGSADASLCGDYRSPKVAADSSNGSMRVVVPVPTTPRQLLRPRCFLSVRYTLAQVTSQPTGDVPINIRSAIFTFVRKQSRLVRYVMPALRFSQLTRGTALFSRTRITLSY